MRSKPVMKRSILALCTSCLISLAVVQASEYSVVVSRQTKQRPEWQSVVDALLERHSNAVVLVWEKEVSEVLPLLQDQHPRHTCFVARPEEAGRGFVAAVHQLTRQYDPDPYTDTLWGILTGYDAANALAIAKTDAPLNVKKIASGTELALELCEQGVWYDELVKNKKVSKDVGGVPTEQQGPSDTTRALADTLTTGAADLFVTSGHATERNWQIGFRYKNGTFKSKQGQMFGVPLQGKPFPIASSEPRVYMAIGNCLMGHIDGPDAMALAWMNGLGVRQMVGYTVVTWYGYGGWGVLDYFTEQPGRYTLSEAFHANHHALIHRLDHCFDGVTDIALEPGSQRLPAVDPNSVGKQLGLSPADCRGLLWDRDTVAFYGDPAWEARLSSRPKAYGQKLEIQGNTYTLTITPQLESRSFEPVNTNGAQRGWRPIVQLLDHRIHQIALTSGDDLGVVIADDFILMPNPRTVDQNREYVIQFTAKRVD
ncbi:hypothetical protein N9B17_02075 [Rhodopirellula sp.]|nr:hypothetical protein [Rhodopirellula sp.]